MKNYSSKKQAIGCWIILFGIVILLGFATFVYKSSENQHKQQASDLLHTTVPALAQVGENTFDDGYSTVYISLSGAVLNLSMKDKIDYLTSEKRAWETNNPNRHIVSIALHSYYGGVQVDIGLLFHYE